MIKIVLVGAGENGGCDFMAASVFNRENRRMTAAYHKTEFLKTENGGAIFCLATEQIVWWGYTVLTMRIASKHYIKHFLPQGRNKFTDKQRWMPCRKAFRLSVI